MRRMLIVEDERDLSDCLKEFFTMKGFSVESVFSGEEAVERLKQQAIDVVLLDVMLPGVSGLEVLRRIKAIRPEARVVIMTGIDQQDIREEAQHCGACGYITKPFDFSDATWFPVFSDTPTS